MKIKSQWKKFVIFGLPVFILILCCLLFIRFHQSKYMYTTGIVTSTYDDHFNMQTTVKLPDNTVDTEVFSIYVNECKNVQNYKGKHILFLNIHIGDKVCIKNSGTVLTISPERFEKIYLIVLEKA